MNEQKQYEDEINLVDYIKVLYKRRWMIIILVFVSTFFVGTLSLFKPKMYEAQATFFPMNVREYYSPQPEALAMKRQLDIEDLIISILESRKMADRIIEQLNLKELWKEKLMADARKALRSASKITLEINGIIKLSVKTKSPKLSAKIANAYVDNLDYFNRELDLGAQSKIVQVIDRATEPEKRMPRGTIKKTVVGGMVSFVFAVFLAFFLEFIQKSDIKKRLREELR